MKQFIISKTVTQRIGFNMSLVALTVAGACDTVPGQPYNLLQVTCYTFEMSKCPEVVQDSTA